MVFKNSNWLAPTPIEAKTPAAIGAPQQVILPNMANRAAPNPVIVDFPFFIYICLKCKYIPIGRNGVAKDAEKGK